MDLVLKVNLTFVDIESDEPERAAVLLPVRADIDPLQGAHLCAPEEVSSCARPLIPPRRRSNI